MDACSMSKKLVWDAHSCLPLRPGLDFSVLSRHAAAGVDFVSINVGMDFNPWPDMLRVIASYRAWILARPEQFVLAGRVEDVEAARRDGKMAIAFDLEGSEMLDGDIDLFRLFRDLGVRQIHLAYNRNNKAAGGCHDAEDGNDVGLSDWGRRIVAAANEFGVMMDCSHSSYRTSMEVMDRSLRPVVFSHANARALTDHPRNIRDDQIRACAATGGVVGITGIGPFLGVSDDLAAAMLRHIDHVAALVGPAHVGLGFDASLMPGVADALPPDREPWWPSRFGYGGNTVRAGADQLPVISEGLQRRGYDDATVRGILGENFLRVARACWLP
jgi:membrane dipeptidase